MSSSLRYLLLVALPILLSINGTRTFCGHPCPFQWISFGDHCYLLVLQRLTWADAETYCKQLPTQRYGTAHLVWINSLEEQQFVEATLHEAVSSFWLGLNDIEEKGAFVWTGTSGSPGFTQWRPGYSSSHNNYTVCATSYRARWYATNCRLCNHFVCKVDNIRS
ncbi:snaclec convulxin subunit beta-like [Acanthaster planci]|uniref:Snaclec convulxin subunit beta-like n=1 Tax=Acanthaster planci TaxID=133434 RepID=A0A8B7XYS2_ACAPL|nr:snaclec convulxin subunit beta-like [Acanthaster planci]